MMEYFAELGRYVRHNWRKRDFRLKDLPEVATEALERKPPPCELCAASILESALSTIRLPEQLRVVSEFGQPALTVYADDLFVIDAYVWQESTTAVHQHSFWGAFTPIEGRTLHTTFSFEASSAPSDYLHLGNLKVLECGILEKGSVERILAGPEFIHSAFHLSHPSTTLVIRSVWREAYYPIQFSYHGPHVAVDPQGRTPGATKRLEIVRGLLRLQSDDGDEAIFRYLKEADIASFFWVLEAIVDGGASFRDGKGRYIDLAKERWPDRAGLLEDSVFEMVRRRKLHMLRGSFRDEDERLLLGLLGVGASREAMIRVFSEAFPGEVPERMVFVSVAKVLRELGKRRAQGKEGGVMDLTEATIQLLPSVIAGLSAEDAAANAMERDSSMTADEREKVHMAACLLEFNDIVSPFVSR